MKSTKKASKSTVTKVAAKAPKANKKTLSFQEGSFRAKTFQLLSEGKALTAEQIVKGVGGKKSLKKRTPIQFVRPIIDRLKAAGVKVTSPEIGTYQISRRAIA